MMDYDYRLIRSKRKSIAIYIKNEEIEVRAPYQVSIQFIDDFVKSKSNWIDKALIKSREKSKQKNDFTIKDDDNIYYLGKPYNIKLSDIKKVEFRNGVFYVPDMDFEKKKSELIVFYKKEALKYLNEAVSNISERIGIKYSSLKINGAKTRWGSCSIKGNLNFTYKLMFLPVELIEYVIIHELSHIKVHNHSANFWRVVESIMPDYKQRQKTIKNCQQTVIF